MSKCPIKSFVLSLAIALALGGCSGVDEPLTAHSSEEAAKPLRVKTDLARGTRWELRWGSVEIHDTATGRMTRALRLPGAMLSAAAESCVPDMVLTRDGAAWISSNATPVLWRISPERFEVERFEIRLEDSRGLDVGFSALVASADERELFAASAATGTLWRIELGAARAMPVALNAPIHGACGLQLAPRFTAKEPIMFVKIGTVASAQRVLLSADGTRGEVRSLRTIDLASAR